MTSLYATPRKARVISTGEVVHIHGYAQESGSDCLVTVAIVEQSNGVMGTEFIGRLQLDAPIAPQLGRSEQAEQTSEKPAIGTCHKCLKPRTLSEQDADGNPICYECWDSGLPF